MGGRHHGYTKTSIHAAWLRMKARCHRPSDPDWSNYGGRGIAVCERWLGIDGFTNFLADVGEKPSRAHSLDRIDSNGDYEPSNVRWALPKVQARIEHGESTRSVADRMGLSVSHVCTVRSGRIWSEQKEARK